MPAPNLTGTIPPGWTPAYGGAPAIPDPTVTAGSAIGGDLANMGNLSALGNQYNQFGYNQRLGQVSGTPGFSDVLANLYGMIPQDVQNRVSQTAAERGVSGGSPGSPNANAALLAAMGKTSLDIQQLGQSQYGNLLGAFPGAAPFNMSQFLVTPEEQQAAQAAANVSAAAPNPQAAAEAELNALLAGLRSGQGTVPTVGGTIPPLTGPATPTAAGGGGGGVPGYTAAPTQPGRSITFPPDLIAQAASGTGFGAPITSPGMSYNLPPPGASAAPFGTPISSPGVGYDPSQANWWEDPANLFPYETGTTSESDLGQFGQPITAPSMGDSTDWWNDPAYDLPYEGP